MSEVKQYEQAVQRITSVISNDADYPSPILKLGAIWSICDDAASYERGEHSAGRYVEVLPKRPTDALQSKLDSAVEALKKYGRHLPACNSHISGIGPFICSCGLDTTLARLGIDTGGKTA